MVNRKIFTAKRLPEIDSLKGIAILFVILQHTISGTFLKSTYDQIHISQAVPIFVALTFYLSFVSIENKELSIQDWFSNKRFKKVCNRVLVPYISVLLLQVLILLIHGSFNLGSIIIAGGYGPGSYYVWVYLQLWLIAPFAHKLLKYNSFKGSFYILLICVLLNCFCSYFCPEFLWRLLSVRYLFLAVIAWFTLTNVDIKKEKYFIYCLAFLSFIYLIHYYSEDWSPFVYNGKWNTQNYPTYFWTLFVIIILLRLILHLPHRLKLLFEWGGRYSWEIFLSQMFVIGFVRHLPDIVNPLLTSFLYVLFVSTLSIGLVVLYLRIKNSCSWINFK